MSELRQLQQDFQAYILEKDKRIEQHLTHNNTIDYQARLNIYRNAYFIRLVAALRRAYTALANYLGEAKFEALATSYLAAFPSTHYDIAQVGKHFAAYLKQTRRCDPFMIDLVNFEQAFSQVMQGDADAALTLKALAQIAPERWPQLRFSFHAGVRIVATQYAVDEIWQALLAAKKIKLPTLQPSYYLVWREGADNFYQQLSEQHYQLGAMLLAKQKFSAICDAFSTDQESDLQWLGCCIRDWVEAGYLSSCCHN